MPRLKYRVPQTIAFKQPDGTLNVFTRNEELGRGSFSIVYRVIHQNTNKIYAMKVISKKRYSKNKEALEDLKNEIKIQKIVKHPNIVSLDYSFTDGRNQYFILEYCPGRTIREYLNKSLNFRVKEPEARKILKDVIQGLIYIHGQGITHYDIKLENFVIDSNGNIKIGDFGLSTFHKDEIGKKFSIFGTFNYLSPEMLSRKNREDSSKVDIWAVGVSAFYILTGRPPFEGKTKEIIFSNILRCDFRFPLNFPISKEAKDFIRSILQLDPRKRPTAKELLSHPFLTKIDNEEVCLYKQSNSCLPPLNKDQNDNKKITLCPPLFDDKIKTPITSNCNKPISARPNMVNKNSPLLIPIKDNKQNNQNSNMKPSPILEPINCNKPSSARSNFQNTTAIQKTPLCPPPITKDLKQAAPRPFSSKAAQQQQQQQPSDENKPKQIYKKAFCPPLNDFKPISPRCLVISPQCTVNNKQMTTVNNFIIPHHFVSRYCFLSNEMCYLLLDGTVGVCFRDKTRIVMDPDEIFVHFYKDSNTAFPDIIQLGCNIKDDYLQEKVSLVIKAATHFKKIRFSYDLPEHEYESSVILHNVKCFVKNDDSILFELDDKNFQINFNDNVKLIIFWNIKKLCFVRSIREKCALLDVKSVASLSSNSDELKKFKNAKILLSDLSLTLC